MGTGIVQEGSIMTQWIGVPDDISEYVGFVYIITNKTNGFFYIGQKKYWSKIKLKPLKGKTRYRHKVKESDWKSYYGSCKELQEDVKELGTDKFTRTILHNFESKADMNYTETQLLFEHEVLYDDKAYNKIINCRINQNRLTHYTHNINNLIKKELWKGQEH